MQKLIQGLHHFQEHVFSSQQELFKRLSEGQNPDALFITCSDSRIDPNLITHTEPGDLFVLRNAGNIIPAHNAATCGEEATIEFAVVGLKVTDIIVCGHSHCGAMKSLFQPDALKDMPNVASWLAHADATRRIVQEKYPERTDAARLITAIEENVLVQIENLRTHPAVAAGLARQTLNLHAWVYKIETGEIFAYDTSSGQFSKISAVSEKPANRKVTSAAVKTTPRIASVKSQHKHQPIA